MALKNLHLSQTLPSTNNIQYVKLNKSTSLQDSDLKGLILFLHILCYCFFF